jgi:hypothetical protein
VPELWGDGLPWLQGGSRGSLCQLRGADPGASVVRLTLADVLLIIIAVCMVLVVVKLY